jgi:hypothetical protein
MKTLALRAVNGSHQSGSAAVTRGDHRDSIVRAVRGGLALPTVCVVRGRAFDFINLMLDFSDNKQALNLATPTHLYQRGHINIGSSGWLPVMQN